MKGLENMLLAEQRRLENIVQQVNERLKNAPEGSLRLSKTQNYSQYYHCTEENKRGSYISKENEELVQKLAQKSYDEKVLRCVEKRLSQIKKLTKDYKDNEIEEIYTKEHPVRQKLIEPVELIWEQKLENWKAKEYKGKEFQEGMPVILTERGERVRSKSEKILADYFYRRGIEYKYECPLYLKGMGVVYPDFTFLSPKSNREIYWEHHGKMDDSTYARKTVRKIQAYVNNDIFPGERLIATYETEQTLLSTKIIEKLVDKHLV